jgi:hypothetical protein
MHFSLTFAVKQLSTMRDYYIFDIPIYRTTSRKFYSEIDVINEKMINKILSISPNMTKLPPDDEMRIKDHIIQANCGPWQFNQIIGWLRLYIEGSGIGCHFWWVQVKKIYRCIHKKLFRMVTLSDGLGLHLTHHETSDEIYAKLCDRLNSLAREKDNRKYHFDFEVFQRIGPFIDWKSLLSSQK